MPERKCKKDGTSKGGMGSTHKQFERHANLTKRLDMERDM